MINYSCENGEPGFDITATDVLLDELMTYHVEWDIDLECLDVVRIFIDPKYSEMSVDGSIIDEVVRLDFSVTADNLHEALKLSLAQIKKANPVLQAWKQLCKADHEYRKSLRMQR